MRRAARMSDMEARSNYDRNEQRPDILRPYASNFLYNAAGAVTAMRLGNGRWTGLDVACVSRRFDAARERASPGKMSFKLYVTTSLMITLQEKQQSTPDLVFLHLQTCAERSALDIMG